MSEIPPPAETPPEPVNDQIPGPERHGPTDWFEPFGAPPGARVRRRRRTRPVVALSLAAGTMAATAFVTHQLWPAASGPRTAAAITPASSGGPIDVSSVAARVDPAVVDINTTYRYQQASGAGTGIVLTPDGEVLTNNHVINGATSISVTDVGDGRTYPARVVGYDATDDVAVLQLVGASGLQTASIGRAGSLNVGQEVVAIGNAGGAGGIPSAAAGTVTALDQAITASDELDGTSESLSHLIETDAAIQSGDSGGPLVNRAGQVVGMDTAATQGYSLQSALGAATRGYAIPIERALAIAGQIEAGRSSSTVHVGPTAFLGVLISSPTSAFGSPAAGAAVGGVVAGGPAGQAGLAAGDVITSLGGRAVPTPAALSRLMAQEQPGRTVQIGWTDPEGASHTAPVTLQSGPPA